MALEGTLQDLSLPDIIQLLSLSRKTGALEIRGSDGFGTGRLYFHQGKVVSAALGDLPPLEAAYSFFTFPDGSFLFDESEQVLPPGPPITISNEFLIIEGTRRADEWQQLRDRVPSLDMVLGLVADPVASTRDINLKPDEWRVLTMINGRDTIHEIAGATGFGDFKTARIVYHLLSAGLIEPLQTSPTPALTAAPVPPVPPGPVVIPPPAGVANGMGALHRPARGETRPLGPAPPAIGPPTAATLVEPALAPAAGPATRTVVPPAGPRTVGGAALYSRFEAIAVGGLGNSGRLLLSGAYQRLHLHPAADITLDAALKFCEQFERDASMLAGSSRARQIAEKLRQAVNESFRG